MMRLRWGALVVVGMAAPASAAAEVVASPYLHVNFGDVEARRGGPGLSAGYLGRWVGLELDASYHDHFFKDAALDSVPNPCRPGAPLPCVDDDTDAWLLRADVLVPLRLSRAPDLVPYGSAGLGVIHAWVHDAGPYDSAQTNLASDLGGGVLYWFTGWLAVRADLRWFHAFVDESKREGGYYHDYDFGRVSVGLTFAPLPTARH
jgi:opacity protein-like surface antigen